jgi:hypothetical protein
MIVWGGLSRGATQVKEVSDGASYDPANDTWKGLPSPPSVPRAVDVASAWTGASAVFWAGNSPDGPPVGLTYNPSTNGWKTLSAGPLGARESFVSFWTGSELAIVGGTSGDGFASPVAAAVSPQTGTWRQYKAINALKAFIPNGATWNGSQAFVTGRRYLCPEQGSSCTDHKNMFFAYDPTSDAITTFDLSSAPVDPSERGSLAPIGWTGTEVALVVGDDLSAGLIFFDPTAGAWRTGARPPFAAASSQRAWLGNGYALPGVGGRLELYDVTGDSWRVIAAGVSPMSTRDQSAIVWTGSQLIVWSGTTSAPNNPTPNTGASVALSS